MKVMDVQAKMDRIPLLCHAIAARSELPEDKVLAVKEYCNSMVLQDRQSLFLSSSLVRKNKKNLRIFRPQVLSSGVSKIF